MCEKIITLIGEAAAKGAELIVFPELFIPGYPYGMTYGFTVGSRSKAGREDWKTYYDNSILVDGPEMQRIVDCVKEHSVYVSVGYSERDAVTATIYNSNVMIAPDGQTMNHRKPETDRPVSSAWSREIADKRFLPGNGDTRWGPMGNLICWESYMPLARVALYQKGVALYISPNTNDNEEWQNTIRHIAIEGHCFFINADMYFTKDMYPKTASGDEEIAKLNDIVCRGGSCVIDPYGHAVSETVWDKEEIIYADLDMQKVPASRMEHDVCGHYARPDVLKLSVEDK
ncbi:MAG: carbon-nitrogen hydrolase family protein [Pilosibacter sp.]